MLRKYSLTVPAPPGFTASGFNAQINTYPYDRRYKVCETYHGVYRIRNAKRTLSVNHVTLRDICGSDGVEKNQFDAPLFNIHNVYADSLQTTIPIRGQPPHHRIIPGGGSGSALYLSPFQGVFTARRGLSVHLAQRHPVPPCRSQQPLKQPHRHCPDLSPFAMPSFWARKMPRFRT